MFRMLFRWLITTFTILTIPSLVSGVQIDGFGTALAAAAILSILNVSVRPLLIVLTLPLTIVSLGIFILVINALIFQLAGSLIQGFHVDSFQSAFLAALIVSVVSWATNLSGGRGRWAVQRGRSGQPPQASSADTIELQSSGKGRWE